MPTSLLKKNVKWERQNMPPQLPGEGRGFQTGWERGSRDLLEWLKGMFDKGGMTSGVFMYVS